MGWEPVNKPALHMQKIDSHQHFWHYDATRHSWIDDSMAIIRKDFLPANLLPLLQQNNVAGCVAVQADETEAENDFLLSLVNENAFIKGVVGWVELTAKNVQERLAYYKQFSSIKGFRYILQGLDPSFMLQPNFINGIAALQPFSFTYDLLIFPKHLPAAIQLVKKFPQQKFVIDHIAKPYIKAGLIDEWKRDIKAIAQHDNVWCKISGMATEADHRLWQPAHLTPYIDTVVQAFGTKRIMYGSDWPVCLVAGRYQKIIQVVENYFVDFTTTEQTNIFSNNANSFYQLQN